MATVLSKPAAYNLAGNIPNIVLSSATAVDFSLVGSDGTILLEERYNPVNGRININLKDFIESTVKIQHLTFENENVVELGKFYYKVDGVTSGLFYILPGGISVSSIDVESFLKGNFLTWQPQTHFTTMVAPQWLRYFAIVESRIKMRGYYADNSLQDIMISSVPAGHLFTFNTNYGYLTSKFSRQPLYIDIHVEDTAGAILSYTQRYIVCEDANPNSDYFVFANSLGGYDTVRFAGQSKEISESESRIALLGEISTEYGVDYKKSQQKFTGYIVADRYNSAENIRSWILDFFSSSERYVVDNGIIQRIYVSKPKLENISGELGGYEFTYALARQSKYLNIYRGKLPNVIEIIDPVEEVFFFSTQA